jgi:hypothetical protein
MKMHIKPINILACGSILLSALLCQTVQATLGPGGSISGVSVLADIQGTATGSEALTVDWSVSESLLGGVYTYSYTVNNPLNDVLLGGTNAGAGEIVDAFGVSFHTAGADVLSITGGSEGGASPKGVGWELESPTVAAGTNSGPLTFTSDLPPQAGNASANDSDPPAPWSTFPNGTPVPVPGNGSLVPDATDTMTLLAGMMVLLPFRSNFKRIVRK